MRTLLAKKPCGFFSSQFLAHDSISPRVSHYHPHLYSHTFAAKNTLRAKSTDLFCDVYLLLFEATTAPHILQRRLATGTTLSEWMITPK